MPAPRVEHSRFTAAATDAPRLLPLIKALFMTQQLENHTHEPHAESSDLPGVRFGKKRWTFGHSASLVEGANREPAWVSAAWIAIPTAVAVLLLALMAGA